MIKSIILITSCSILALTFNNYDGRVTKADLSLQADTAKAHQQVKTYKVEFYIQVVLHASGATTYKRTSLNIGVFSVSIANAGDGYYNITGTEYYIKFLDDLAPDKTDGMLNVHAGEGENNEGEYTEAGN